MILVTHEITLAHDVASRVVFMDDGRIAAQGPSQEVFGTRTNKRLRAFLARIELKDI
jgi:ABC-type polar amino acid transport system ATPase subunit